MNPIQKAAKPACTLLMIVLLVTSTFHQSASAAMVGTANVLQSSRQQTTRAALQALLSRQKAQELLMTWGIDPQEARARIDSLSDAEIALIAEKMANAPAGGHALGFIVVCALVVIVLIFIVEYTSVVKMFPQLESGH